MEQIYLYRAFNNPTNFATIGHLHDGVIVLTTTTTNILQSFVSCASLGFCYLNLGLTNLNMKRKTN